MSETIDAPQDSLNGSQGSGSGERKVNVRARVWRACEVCRKRKVKCNGQEPCSYCLSSGKICSFKDISDNAALARQQANTVDSRLSKVEETLRGLLPMTQAFEAWLQKNPHASQLPFSMPNAEAGPSTQPQSFPPRNTDAEAYRPSTAVQRLSRFPTNGASGSPASISDPVEDETLDGPEQWSDRFSHLTKDSYGNLRYTGGASTYMLVDALTTLQDSTTDASPESQSSRRNVDITLPFFNPGHYFKTQEALPRPEDIPYPTPEEGDELVEIFFKSVHYSFPLLHQHLFLERYMKVMTSKHSGRPSRDTAFLALMFSVFACGSCVLGRKQHNASSKSSAPTSDFRGIDYYQRAQLLFWMCSGESQIEQVQCLALLAVCNASWNTLAQGWLNAGQAIRRAQDLGLHRSSRRSNMSAIDKEIRRRVWWCVYSLDRLLSMALGRPSGAHDDDCNVELPVELDDAQLLASSEGSAPRPGSTHMTGFIALLKIYVIAGKVMRFVHSPRIDDPFSEDTQDVVASLDEELEAWINGLPPSVRFAANDRQNPQMLSLCLITFFIYYSSIINLHRPFIPDDSSPSNDLTSLGQCMSAARSCIRIGEITQEMLPSSHYMAFAVQFITLSGVVLLRCIHYVNDEELVSAIIHDAEKCVSILEGLEDVWPASKRCREIVSDLLVVVKMKLNGGPIAIENLQAPQETMFPNSEERPLSSKGKRKRADTASDLTPVRASVNGQPPWGDLRSDVPTFQHEMAPPPDCVQGMPLSNMRTSMDPHSSHRFTASVSSSRASTSRSLDTGDVGAMGPPHTPTSRSGYTSPPRLSLDINALYSGEGISGLPFAYEFIGDDLLALLGNVISKPTQPITGGLEDNAQLLWQAFHGQRDTPFTSAYGSANGHP